MHRNRNLYEKFKTNEDRWIPGIYIDNLPENMLANEYIMHTAIIVNSVLLTVLVNSEDTLTKYDISNNK